MLKNIKIVAKASVEFLPLMIFWSSDGRNIVSPMILCILLIILGVYIKRKSFMLNGIFIMLVSFFIIDFLGISIDNTMVSYLILGLICSISVLINRPYTMYLSKGEYQEISDSPLFIEMNVILSNIFAGVYYICFLVYFFAIPMKGVLIPLFIFLGVLATFILPKMMPET
jgi:hypothetical protein